MSEEKLVIFGNIPKTKEYITDIKPAGKNLSFDIEERLIKFLSVKSSGPESFDIEADTRTAPSVAIQNIDVFGNFERELGTKYTYRQGDDLNIFKGAGRLEDHYGNVINYYYSYDRVPHTITQMIQEDAVLGFPQEEYTYNLPVHPITNPLELPADQTSTKAPTEAELTTKAVVMNRYYTDRIEAIDGRVREYARGQKSTKITGDYDLIIDRGLSVNMTSNSEVEFRDTTIRRRMGSQYVTMLDGVNASYMESKEIMFGMAMDSRTTNAFSINAVMDITAGGETTIGVTARELWISTLVHIDIIGTGWMGPPDLGDPDIVDDVEPVKEAVIKDKPMRPLPPVPPIPPVKDRDPDTDDKVPPGPGPAPIPWTGGADPTPLFDGPDMVIGPDTDLPKINDVIGPPNLPGKPPPPLRPPPIKVPNINYDVDAKGNRIAYDPQQNQWISANEFHRKCAEAAGTRNYASLPPDQKEAAVMKGFAIRTKSFRYNTLPDRGVNHIRGTDPNKSAEKQAEEYAIMLQKMGFSGEVERGNGKKK